MISKNAKTIVESVIAILSTESELAGLVETLNAKLKADTYRAIFDPTFTSMGYSQHPIDNVAQVNPIPSNLLQVLTPNVKSVMDLNEYQVLLNLIQTHNILYNFNANGGDNTLIDYTPNYTPDLDDYKMSLLRTKAANWFDVDPCDLKCFMVLYIQLMEISQHPSQNSNTIGDYRFHLMRLIAKVVPGPDKIIMDALGDIYQGLIYGVSLEREKMFNGHIADDGRLVTSKEQRLAYDQYMASAHADHMEAFTLKQEIIKIIEQSEDYSNIVKFIRYGDHFRLSNVAINAIKDDPFFAHNDHLTAWAAATTYIAAMVVVSELEKVYQPGVDVKKMVLNLISCEVSGGNQGLIPLEVDSLDALYKKCIDAVTTDKHLNATMDLKGKIAVWINRTLIREIHTEYKNAVLFIDGAMNLAWSPKTILRQLLDIRKTAMAEKDMVTRDYYMTLVNDLINHLDLA